MIIRIINNQITSVKFSQKNYYSSVSKNIPIGVEIARLTIENSSDDCVYSIDTVERIKSYDLFRINSSTGSITVMNSLVNCSSQRHLLTILYYCEHNYHIAYTNLHINILNEKSLLNQTMKLYRFTQDNYLIIFQTSLKKMTKYLMKFELISNDDDDDMMTKEKTIRKPNAKILHGMFSYK